MINFIAEVAMPKKKALQKTRLVQKKGPIKSTPSMPHRWRICPAGHYWVRAYERDVQISKKNPDCTTSVRGHCRTNPSHKDQIYRDEMHEIARQYFKKLGGGPTSDDFDLPNGNLFDNFIRGWTKYWNEVLNPDEPLDPDLVKAIIFSESTFNPDAGEKSKKKDAPRGLMQIMDSTREILADEKGELKDHLVNLTDQDAYDSNLNIAAGIRWLFRKKEIASSKLN